MVDLPQTTRQTGSTALLRGFRAAFLGRAALSIPIYLALGLLVVLPLAHLLLSSLYLPKTDSYGIDNYLSAYGRSRYVQALVNSVALGLCTAVLCAVIALPLAWGVSRTNMPGKWLVWLAVMGAFIMPPYLLTIGWILLAGPNAGGLNEVWRAVTGSETALLNIYTFEGMVLVTALNSFPFVFLFTKSALDMISSELEEAASILGAPGWYSSIKITLPLIWPSIIGALIIVFLESIALLGVPALLGIPARVNVVTTQLLEFFGHPVRLQVAAAYAMPLLLITISMIWLQKKLLARKGFVTQSGKGGERRALRLGPVARWSLTAWALFIGLGAFFAPAAMMLRAALSTTWTLPLSWSNFTLDNFANVLFHHSLAKNALWNSLQFGFFAALLACAVALIAAYGVARRLVWGGTVINFLCMAPFVIPGIVIAIGFYAAYAVPPFALYGTALMLILAFAARFLPITFGTTSAGIKAINPEMEEAVRILGGGRMTALFKVVLPLLKKTMFGAFLLAFIPATRELSAAIFLVAPNTRVASILVFDMTEEGRMEAVSALGCVMLVGTMAFVALGFRIIGRDFMMRKK